MRARDLAAEMKITNTYNLPAPLVRLVSGGDRTYAPNTVSVTGLLRPPQQAALERAHADEICEDASDRIWATFGTLMHYALERAGHDNALVEERLQAEIDGWTVSGAPDLVEQVGPDQYAITDWKFVGVATTYQGPREEWVEQLNLYAHLLRLHGFDVRVARVCVVYRDWMRSKSLQADYPPPAQVLGVPLWPDEIAGAFLRRKLADYTGTVRPCTDEERWLRPTTWAVTKKGNVRASRVLSSRAEAERWAAKNVPANRDPVKWFDVVERPGEAVRCASYCRVAEWCEQAAGSEQQREGVLQA